MTLKHDPTRTALVRRKFATELSKQFRSLKQDIKELLITEDAFGLKQTHNHKTGHDERSHGNWSRTSGVETIQLWSKPVRVYRNPTPSIAKKWLAKSEHNKLRGMKTENGDSFIWDAGAGTHQDVADRLRVFIEKGTNWVFGKEETIDKLITNHQPGKHDQKKHGRRNAIPDGFDDLYGTPAVFYPPKDIGSYFTHSFDTEKQWLFKRGKIEVAGEDIKRHSEVPEGMKGISHERWWSNEDMTNTWYGRYDFSTGVVTLLATGQKTHREVPRSVVSALRKRFKDVSQIRVWGEYHEPTKKRVFLPRKIVHNHAQHDQKTHGNWSRGKQSGTERLEMENGDRIAIHWNRSLSVMPKYLESLRKKSKHHDVIRGLLMPSGDRVVWSAYDATHREVTEALGWKLNEFIIGGGQRFTFYDMVQMKQAKDFFTINHYGPGPHKTGTEQTSHGRKKSETISKVIGRPGQYRSVDIHINPSASQLKALIYKSRGKELRGLSDGENTWWWDSYRMIHSQGQNALGTGDKVIRMFVGRSDHGYYYIGPQKTVGLGLQRSDMLYAPSDPGAAEFIKDAKWLGFNADPGNQEDWDEADYKKTIPYKPGSVPVDNHLEDDWDIRNHYGPGPHKTGTEQSAHGGNANDFKSIFIGGHYMRDRMNEDLAYTSGIIDGKTPLFFEEEIEHYDFFRDLREYESYSEEPEEDSLTADELIEWGIHRRGIVTFRKTSRDREDHWWFRVQGPITDRTIDQLLAFSKVLPKEERSIPVMIDVDPWGVLGAHESIDIDNLSEKEIFSLFKEHVHNARFVFDTVVDQVKKFEHWLQKLINKKILSVRKRSATSDRFIKDGYERGSRRAFRSVRKDSNLFTKEKSFDDEMIRISTTDVDRLRALQARTFDDIKGVTNVMRDRMKRVLSDGLLRGDSPEEIAQALSREIDDIGIKRARLIAQTEIVRAHAEGALDSMERLGVEYVTMNVEWSTAGDDRVCALCKPLDGLILTIKQARGMIPRHPRCRCSPIPVTDKRPHKSTTRSRINKSVMAEIPKSKRARRRSAKQQRRRSRWVGARVK